MAGFDTVVQFLADKGANLNAKDSDGRTPRALATSFEFNMTTFENPTTAELLRKLGAGE